MDKSSLVATATAEVQMIYLVEQNRQRGNRTNIARLPIPDLPVPSQQQHHIKHHNKYKYKKQHTY